MDFEIFTPCDSAGSWLAAYALGERDAAPAEMAHLAECQRCQRQLREYRAVAGLMPYAAPQDEPLPDLRARLVAAVERETAAEHATAAPALPAAVPAARPRWQRLARAGWAAYAFGALAIALLGWNISLRSQLADQSAQISFHRQSWLTMVVLLNDSSLHWYTIAGAQANGRVWLTDGGEMACLVAQQLPPLPAGQTYQVWLEQGAERVSGGTFPAREGNGWVLVQAAEPVSAYQRVFVTAEPEGGSPAPSGRPVLDGSLQSGAVPAADRSELQKLLIETFDS